MIKNQSPDLLHSLTTCPRALKLGGRTLFKVEGYTKIGIP